MVCKFQSVCNVLKEDNKIRTYIDTISKVNSISNVKINRNGLNDQIQLNIETGKPGILVGDLGSGLENLLNKIKKILPSSRQLTINVLEVEKVDLDAKLLADLVARTIRKTCCF
jgi:small subunit ribosomal protein S3